MAGLPQVASYDLGGAIHAVTLVKLVIGTLMLVFAGLELSPRFAALEFERRWMPLGGALSGFLGGLSGMQGALRSAFLAKSGLSKDSFIATGVVCAVIVDVSRLAVYGLGALSAASEPWTADARMLAMTATLAAFFGAWLGKKLLAKVTYRAVRMVVAVGIATMGLGMAAGLI